MPNAFNKGWPDWLQTYIPYLILGNSYTTTVKVSINKLLINFKYFKSMEHHHLLTIWAYYHHIMQDYCGMLYSILLVMEL
jgi:hypothetical protein